MLEKMLLQLFILSLYTNVFFAILIVILLIIVTVKTYNENHISRNAD